MIHTQCHSLHFFVLAIPRNPIKKVSQPNIIMKIFLWFTIVQKKEMKHMKIDRIVHKLRFIEKMLNFC